MNRYNSLYCFVILIFVFVHSSCGCEISGRKLVDEVCARTSNFSFCTRSLYSDPRAASSDRYGLADVAIRLANLNATTTWNYITTELLNKATSSRQHLQKCASDYAKAISAIDAAFNDLISESFYDLADLAGQASAAAQDCEDTFKGYNHSPLHFMNNALKGLCQICVVVAELFTTEQ